MNAHNNTQLPAMLFGGQALGIKHQGHLSQKDTRLGNLWQSYFQVLGVKVPDNFQGGEADGVITKMNHNETLLTDFFHRVVPAERIVSGSCRSRSASSCHCVSPNVLHQLSWRDEAEG